MTPEQKKLVQASWSDIRPARGAVGGLFYGRLFASHPEVKPYFRGDMWEQSHKLTTMIDTMVGGLDDLDALATKLARSGKAHAGYGVRPDDYQKVGDALLWALQRLLGDAFTPQVREAWTAMYAVASRIMNQGAGYPPGVD